MSAIRLHGHHFLCYHFDGLPRLQIIWDDLAITKFEFLWLMHFAFLPVQQLTNYNFTSVTYHSSNIIGNIAGWDKIRFKHHYILLTLQAIRNRISQHLAARECRHMEFQLLPLPSHHWDRYWCLKNFKSIRFHTEFCGIDAKLTENVGRWPDCVLGPVDGGQFVDSTYSQIILHLKFKLNSISFHFQLHYELVVVCG